MAHSLFQELIEIDADLCIACCQVKELFLKVDGGIYIKATRASTVEKLHQVQSRLDQIKTHADANHSDFIEAYIPPMQELIISIASSISIWDTRRPGLTEKQNISAILTLQCDAVTHMLANAKQCEMFASKNTDEWTTLLRRIVDLLDKPLK